MQLYRRPRDTRKGSCNTLGTRVPQHYHLRPFRFPSTVLTWTLFLIVCCCCCCSTEAAKTVPTTGEGSDPEDYVPVPDFQSAFSEALVASDWDRPRDEVATLSGKLSVRLDQWAGSGNFARPSRLHLARELRGFTFSQPFGKKCISVVVRIGSTIIFHLSKL